MICVFTKIYAVIGAHGCSLKRTTIVRRERRERGRKRYIFVCVCVWMQTRVFIDILIWKTERMGKTPKQYIHLVEKMSTANYFKLKNKNNSKTSEQERTHTQNST